VTAVLIVEDEDDAAFALTAFLTGAGHEVERAADGPAALRAVERSRPQLVVLDVGLPGLDGWQVLAALRDTSDVPVLMLTGHSEVAERVRGLDGGADDYLTKPYDSTELLARVTALLRRRGLATRAQRGYDDGRLRLDPASRTAGVDGREVPLTPIEFRLMQELVREPGTALSTAQLIARAWGDASGIGPERVKFAVLRLRRKLGWADPASSPLEAVRGFGYRYRRP
jgi:DNA-binding response OmpR family regulator